MAPSTFASAAAGIPQNQNPTRDVASDWSRRTNGATQTFRRPSGAATIASASQQQSETLAQQPPRYVPPHRNGAVPETRHSKDQMLDLFKAQSTVEGGLSDALSNLLLSAWQPDVAANGTWSRTEHNRDAQPGPDICWDKNGMVEPLGLIEMDEEERELFLTSVNTPIKPPASVKENQQTANGMPTRKASISGSLAGSGGFGLPSPSVTRGAPRRRETSESYPFPHNSVTSPGGFSREDQRAASPPPALLRRRTDINKIEDRDKEGDERAANPFGSLKRHPTGPLGGGFAAPSSPWSTGPQSAGLAPMGSFGNFGIGSQAGTGGDKRPGLGGGRAESRFKGLLHKDSIEDTGKTIEGKASTSSLSKAHENESWRKQERADNVLDEADEHLPTGSAALGADADLSPPHQRQGHRGLGTPSRQGTADEYGFSAFGMTSDTSHGFGHGFLPGRDAFHQSPAHQRVSQGLGGNEPMSPTDTNPYQSPEQHGVDRMAEGMDGEGSDLHNAALPGLGNYSGDPSHQLGGLGGLGALPNLGRAPGPQGPASDRSQTSSVGPNRGFPGLSGLGQLGGVGGPGAWPGPQGGLGTPGRQATGLSNAFGGGIFANPMAELQSPSLAGLGGSIMSPSGGPFSGSRMASMFPPAMQEQMRHPDQRSVGRDGSNERAPGQPFGGLGDLGRATESPFANQGFNDGQPGQPQTGQPDEQGVHFGAPGQHGPKGSQQDATSAGPQPQQPQHGGGSISSQPPPAQQRTMVMPDRMRWIYRDPQGQTQGPWSGLEMHDWYKAGFFSPELLVKKYEDPEYEPLAQLIRRIGNSREPFLVPQIGIPHGPPSSNGPNGWAGSNTAGSAQPPFASSFPSFGTTLTADQQNALERRKQEEQYLMARQKEHLAQAQIAHRMQMQSGHGNYMPSQLHHHSSHHSLQSQPSFGSITSPTGYQASPIQGPSGGHTSSHVPGFFDNSFRQQQSAGLGAVGAGVDTLGHIREEEISGAADPMSLGGRSGAGQFGAPGQPFSGQQQGQQSGQETHAQRVQQMMQDRAQLELEQAEYDAARSEDDDEPTTNERLQQFEELQDNSPQTIADTRFRPVLDKVTIPQPSQQSQPRETTALSGAGSVVAPSQEQVKPHETLSLTEQVQKAASAKQSPAAQQTGLPHPFPPAPSQSPLPAPAAQRTGRQTVADHLQEARELSQTPSADTPSAAVAPWAKEPVDAPKGPSLKEIQEAEAKKAAEAEEVAAAARRAAFQKEMEAQQVAALSQPGLPAGATWATGSPATPTGAMPVAWAKPQKVGGPSTAKSMAQIQKEEEARKKKLAAAAAAANAQANVVSNITSAGGKSYANLAGKVSTPPVNATGGAWTTVGAGGKAKTPAAPTPAIRSVSTGVVPTLQAPSTGAAATRKMPARSTTMTAPGGANAQDEFRKWAVNELRPDLNKGISADDFVASLVFLPAEADIITEAVHSMSSTIDSRHFAEEFIRRKKLADKGIVDAAPKSASPYSTGENKSGGWSEVAKKGPSSKEPAREEANGNFRVVAAKKKGGKK